MHVAQQRFHCDTTNADEETIFVIQQNIFVNANMHLIMLMQMLTVIKWNF